MPDAWPSQVKLSRMKYQIVMNLGLLCNRPWLGVISPAIALVCQYLSSTVRGRLSPTFSSPRRREILGLPPLRKKNNLWKQLFRERRLNPISLSDAEKLTQAEG